MNLTSGTLLERGKYRIISTLGRGGFGITYLAEQVLVRRKVCIKEFFPKDFYKRDEGSCSISILSQGQALTMSRFKEKFLKEAQTIAALDHPNIIHILDVFEENNTAYYVMEYVEGGSLGDLVKQRGALAEAVAVRYIKEVASALGHIHEHKINHLDVKPGNIMVRAKDDKTILIDFGLSKHYDEVGEQTSSTPVGISHGYAPMEQYNVGGVNSFSPATDIYSLGATLYYLVTGQQPPVASIVGEEGIGNIPAHLTEDVVLTIEKSMNYWRKNRPQSIDEFMSLLNAHETIEQKIVAEPICEVEVNVFKGVNSIDDTDNEQTIISDASSVEEDIHQQEKKPTHDEIWYTSIDEKIVDPKHSIFSPRGIFGAKIISNSYQNGKGIIKFDGSVTKIGDHAFNNNERLKTIIIPNSVTTIDNYAFYNCKKLENVNIPNSVTTIGSCAFRDSVSLHSVVIPNSVLSVGSYAFANCSGLRQIAISSSISMLRDCVFSGCKSLSSLTIPNSVVSIGNYAFADCSSLRFVAIPNSVLSIGDGAFRGCVSMLNIALSNMVKSIGSIAFAYCYSLSNIMIPDSVKFIGDGAFSGCRCLPYDIKNKILTINRNAVL